MALRTDGRQWLIYQPDTVEAVFKALQASALVMYGAWLQQRAATLPAALSGNVGQIGAVLGKVGDARQQIQAGLAPNDVPDELVAAQRGWDTFVRWLHNPSNNDVDMVAQAVDEIAGAVTYMDQRTLDTGTNHPRWNSRLVSDQPCESCGR